MNLFDPSFFASMPCVLTWLREALEKRRWTPRNLAVRIGVDEKTIVRIIEEKVKTPHFSTIDAISKELQKSPEKLGLGEAYEFRLRNARKRQC